MISPDVRCIYFCTHLIKYLVKSCIIIKMTYSRVTDQREYEEIHLQKRHPCAVQNKTLHTHFKFQDFIGVKIKIYLAKDVSYLLNN